MPVIGRDRLADMGRSRSRCVITPRLEQRAHCRYLRSQMGDRLLAVAAQIGSICRGVGEAVRGRLPGRGLPLYSAARTVCGGTVGSAGGASAL
jgi:hypothetical protein